MFEPISVPPIPRADFVRRLMRQGGYAAVLAGVSLLIGTGGFMAFAKEKWLDAFLNAAMLLGGMGPVETPTTEGGKLFAGAYALYAGMVVLVAASILVAPVMHRYMHKFHLESRERQN